MKEHPILFSAPMVRAILEGRKTMTRRIVKPQPIPDPVAPDRLLMWNEASMTKDAAFTKYCPYGQPADLLWVRETWATWPSMDGIKPSKLYNQMIHYRATFDPESVNHPPAMPKKWRPSIFMPRWASRITLEVVSVKVERVQDITTNDAMSEGVDTSKHVMGDHCPEFMRLWDSMNAKRGYGWDVNPWVWVVEFRRVS